MEGNINEKNLKIKVRGLSKNFESQTNDIAKTIP